MPRTAALLTLLAFAGAAQAETIVVNVFSFNFSTNPQGQAVVDPVINVGDTIRWVLVSGHHTVTSVQGSPEVFDHMFMTPGETFEHTFTNLGVHHYFCQPHGFDNGDGTAGGMAGTITVVPAPGVLGLGAAAGCFALRRRR